MSCDLVVLLSLAELTGIECDAVKEWSNIVELAKRSNVWIYSFCVYTCIVPRLVKYCLPAMHERTCATMNIERKTYIFQVIFNGIDVGEYFDYAVTSLCVSVGVAYVAASSYGHSAVVDCYPSPFLPRDGPCWACNNSPNDRDILAQLVPPHITLLSSLAFIPKVMLRYTSGLCPLQLIFIRHTLCVYISLAGFPHASHTRCWLVSSGGVSRCNSRHWGLGQ